MTKEQKRKRQELRDRIDNAWEMAIMSAPRYLVNPQEKARREEEQFAKDFAEIIRKP